MGIDPERQPSFCKNRRAQSATAYADFWTSLAGRKVSTFGHLVEVPTQMTPFENLDVSRRKRARARRAHMNAVERSASEAIRSYKSPDKLGNLDRPNGTMHY